MAAQSLEQIDWQGQPLKIWQKSQSMALTWGSTQVWTFDLEGRLYTLFHAPDLIQRGLDHRLLRKGRREGIPFRELLSPTEAADWLQARYQDLQAMATGLRSPAALRVMQQWLSWTPERLAEQSEQFKQVYQPISILPPDQYLSLVIQTTIGCSYNRCNFCNFYKNRRFQIRALPELQTHIAGVKALVGQATQFRQGLFLADGDALMAPQALLLQQIDAIRDHWPDLPLYSFMDAFRPQSKSVADLQTLAQRGLKRVYLGIETGQPELLRWLNKPGSPDLMLAEARKIKQAGISLGLILMVGVGGQSWQAAHRQASLDWLRQLELERSDRIFLSAFVPHPDQPYYQDAQRDGILPLSDAELLLETQLWREALQPLSAQIVPYHLQEFLY